MPTRLLPALLCAITLATGAAHAATPADVLAGYGTSGVAARGQAFFTSRHGQDWSCATCHGERPTGNGRHATTGKTISPLAPAFNPERFTEPARVEKWFRRNCNDVLGRACTAQEKADVITWLLTLKP